VTISLEAIASLGTVSAGERDDAHTLMALGLRPAGTGDEVS
jgi:hypothetical protein